MSKQKTLELFHNLPDDPSETFNKAFELYRQSPLKNTGTERRLNMGYTPDSLSIVLYELQKVHSISDLEKIPTVVEEKSLSYLERFAQEIRNSGNKLYLIALKISKVYPTVITVYGASIELQQYVDDAETALGAFTSEYMRNNPESREFFNQEGGKEIIQLLADDIDDIRLPESISTEMAILALNPRIPDDKPIINETDIKNVIVHDEHIEGIKYNHPDGFTISEVNETAEKLSITGTFIPTPERTEEPVKFRDEYPFLKDINCPVALKVLATDKITTYNAYQEAHAKLADFAAGTLQLSEAEQLELAATATENFEASAEIKKELDHYAEHKLILGEHPVFVKLAMEREVEVMDADKCHKFLNSSKSFISRNKSDMAAAVSEDVKAELQAKLDLRLQKLALVKKKLGISE